MHSDYHAPVTAPAPRSHASGFTFIEIVAALAVLAIGILAVITLFPVGLENSKRAMERTRASLLAYQQLQRYRILGYAYVTGALSATQTTDQVFTMGDKYFINRVTVTPYAGATTGTNIQQVTITASWPATQDIAHRRTLTMSTLISDR